MASIVPTKLRLPLLHPHDVPRPALHNWLDTALTTAPDSQRGLFPWPPLIVISACAGAGKTSLLGTWAAGRGAAWLSLDEMDNDPAQFTRYFDAATKNASPHVPLILDNFDLITAPVVHALLADLLTRSADTPAAGQRRVVIATRGTVAPVLAAVGTLELHDLAFTLDETALFLERAFGGRILPAEIEVLHTRTQGWITGLRLASLHGREHATTRAAITSFVAEFSGTLRYIADYLTEEVFDTLPGPIQQFLLHTALLEPLTAPLCDAVTGRTDSALLLAQLARENFFITPYDGGEYRYHPLFADYLRTRQNQTAQSGESHLLHHRAAAWYLQRGRDSQAVDHLLAGGDHVRAAPIVERIASRTRTDVLLRWLESLPEATINTYPALCLYHAFALVNARQLDRLDTVAARLDSARFALGDEVEREPGRQASYAALMAGIEAALAHVRGEPALAAAHAQAAVATAPTPAFRRALTLQLSVDCWSSGDSPTAAAMFERASQPETATAAGNTALAVCQRAYFEVGRGHLREAERRFRDVIETAPEHTPAEIRALAHIGLSDVLREWGDFSSALLHSAEGSRLGSQFGSDEAAVFGAVAQVRAHLSARETDRAAEALRRAEALLSGAPILSSGQAISLRPYVAACRARFHLMRANANGNDVASVANWMRNSRLPPSSAGVRSGAIFEVLTFARALLAQKRYHEAIETLANTANWLAKMGREGDLVECAILLARVHRDQGSMGAALDALGRALRLGEPGSYLRVFLDEGEPLIDLLTRYRQVRRDMGDYIARLLAGARVRTPEGTADMLTAREHEILRLLAAGRSYREIAAELEVAVSTVKTHILSVYSKLGVESRTQAIRRAEEMGLV